MSEGNGWLVTLWAVVFVVAIGVVGNCGWGGAYDSQQTARIDRQATQIARLDDRLDEVEK